MKTIHWTTGFLGLVVGILVGAVGGVFAQGTTGRVTAPVARSGGSLAISRVSDTAYVVVKDHGDFQTTMYYTVEAGIPVLKQNAKYMYPR